MIVYLAYLNCRCVEWVYSVVHLLAVNFARFSSGSLASPLHSLLHIKLPESGCASVEGSDGRTHNKRKYFVTMLFMYEIGEKCVYVYRSIESLNWGVAY